MNPKLLVSGVLLLAGCTAGPQWVKPNATPEELQQDTVECSHKAEHMYVVNDPFDVRAERDFIKRCMQEKGWTPAR